MAAVAVCLLASANGFAEVKTGAVAPAFELKDVNGKLYSLSQMHASPLTVVYFFDVDSRSSQEGLLSINQLVASTKASLKVLAITGSSREKVAQFVKNNKLSFPVLLDPGQVRTEYKAKQILPVICTLGPGLKVFDYFQGGGKTTEKMLARLAERELQRKNTVVEGDQQGSGKKEPEEPGGTEGCCGSIDKRRQSEGCRGGMPGHSERGWRGRGAGQGMSGAGISEEREV